MSKNKILIFSIIKDFLLAIPAGFSISLGAIAFLCCDNKIAGSLFFTIGLFCVLVFSFNLFTGKVCYAPQQKPTYIFNLIGIWCGNLAGAGLTGLVAGLTRLSSFKEKCISLCQTKLNDNLLSIFILAMLCNVMIFIAVYGFKNFNGDLIKVLALFFGVSVFVLCGFEHCVANMFYFTFAGMWSWKMFLYLVVMTLGNSVGGILTYLIFTTCKKQK